jgi:hypothetical protein
MTTQHSIGQYTIVCSIVHSRCTCSVIYRMTHHTVTNSTMQCRSAPYGTTAPYFNLQLTLRYASTIQPAFVDVPYITEQCNTRYDWPIQHRVVHHTVRLTRKTLYIVPCSTTNLCCIAQCTIHKEYMNLKTIDRILGRPHPQITPVTKGKELGRDLLADGGGAHLRHPAFRRRSCSAARRYVRPAAARRRGVLYRVVLLAFVRSNDHRLSEVYLSLVRGYTIVV